MHRSSVLILFSFVLLGIAARSFAASPAPIRTDRLAFDIPFSISPDDVATTQVELLFSFDGGRQWFVYGRVPVEAGVFAFRAPREGEYCFAFRTRLANGETRQVGPLEPQLRIVVDTAPPPPTPKEPERTTPRRRVTSSAPTADPLGGTPVTPPKSVPQPQTTLKPLPPPDDTPTPPAPQVMQEKTPTPLAEGPLKPPPHKSVAKETSVAATNASDNAAQSPLVDTSVIQLPQLIPAAPDAVRWLPPEDSTPAATELGLSDEAIAELIGDMAPRHDAATYQTASVAPIASPSLSSSSAETPRATLPPGRISAVTLLAGDGRPRIAVRWSIPADAKVAANYRVDVLKSQALDGPWRPLVIHYDNSGEYWWHLAAEDFEPFFLAVRTRDAAGNEVTFDKTATAIALDTTMLNR